MPRAPKACGHTGCPSTAVTGRTYCPGCEAERQRAMAARRGSPAARGYGKDHRARRARLEPIVAAGEAMCWRCQETIKPGQAWDLGHDDHDRSITRGPEHARRADCPAGGNRATSARREAQLELPRARSVQR